MKLIRIVESPAMCEVDATAYLEQLPSFADRLPPGAYTYATDPDHYDFIGKRCVKDLKLRQITFAEHDGETCLEIGFRHNCWKHEEDLTVRYVGVHDFAIDLNGQSPWRNVRPEVILDEVLPHEHGCSHEIALRRKTILVTCRDLTAAWTDADCPDKTPLPGDS